MKKFTVERPEVHISFVEVEAETAEEAFDLVYEGEGEEGEEVALTYSYTLDPSEKSWHVSDGKDGTTFITP